MITALADISLYAHYATAHVPIHVQYFDSDSNHFIHIRYGFFIAPSDLLEKVGRVHSPCSQYREIQICEKLGCLL